MIVKKTITKEVEVTDKLICDNCQDEVPLVFKDLESVHSQGSDALEVVFRGGYGMFVDPMVHNSPPFLLCKKCAIALCNTLPCFQKFLINEKTQI